MTDDRKQTGGSPYLWPALFLLMIPASFAQAAPSKTSPVTPTSNLVAAAPDPSSNPVLANIVKLGAKLYYMGTRAGLDGWFIVKDGQVQIAYSTADKKNVIIGAMFGEDGESITSAQVKTLIENNKDLAAMMMGAAKEQQAVNQASTTSPAAPASPAAGTLPSVALSPGDRLYQALATAPGVTLGSGAPKLLMVMDTNCPHCQATWRMLRDAVTKNALQLRMIPIAPADSDSERAATVLMRSPDPLTAWDKYVGPDKGQGDKAQLAGTADPNLVAAIRGNHALIDDWHIDQTPYLVYRAKDGKVKIVVGEPSNVAAVLSDVAP